jgi:diacylglycerol kinase (ATP)
MTVAAPPESALWIVNPIAGRARENRVDERLRDELRDARVHRTTQAGEAGAVAADAVRAGVRTVIVAGGDGTLSDVANAVLDAGAPPDFTLGFVPAGTCNDFARGRELAPRLTDLLDRRRARLVDVGRVTCSGGSRWFLVNSTVGLISTIGERFIEKHPLNLALKRVSIQLAEAVYGIDTILRWRAPRLKLRIGDERVELAATNLAVLKVPYFAGGLRFDSTVAPDDGALEAVAIGALSRPRVLALMLEAFARGELRRRDAIRSWTAQDIHVDADRPVPVEVDGEIAGHTPATFSVEPRCLWTIT